MDTWQPNILEHIKGGEMKFSIILLSLPSCWRVGLDNKKERKKYEWATEMGVAIEVKKKNNSRDDSTNKENDDDGDSDDDIATTTTITSVTTSTNDNNKTATVMIITIIKILKMIK